MSRNKIILLILALVAVYVLLPNSGTGGVVKEYMLVIAPYVLIVLIGYLIITINILKKALYRLTAEINDDNTLSVARMMRMTFDVKRMMGPANLIDLYRQVNFSKNVSLTAKEALYHSMKRKHLDVPPPSMGKEPAQQRESRSSEEVKQARAGANKRNKKIKNKK